MNSLEQFFHSHKALFVIFTIIALPLVLLWSLLYGVVVGIIGITIDRWEVIQRILCRNALETLKYPIWNAKKAQEGYLRTLSSVDDMFVAQQEFQVGRKKVAGPISETFWDLLIFGVALYPFLLVWGIATGPVRAFLDIFKWWYEVWFGYSVYRGGLA